MYEESGKRFGPFIAYLIIFNAAWAGWVYLVYPRMKALGEATLVYALVNIGIRLLIWVLPVFLYLRFVDRAEPIEYLKLKRYWKRGVVIGLALTGINFVLSMARFGIPHPNIHSLSWNSIFGTSLLIGLVEEIPYRGFIFQKLQERLGFWIANLISSILFLGIHLPGWISLQMLRAGTVVFVLIFGVLMVIVFRCSKSLWSVIVTHSLNDFLSFVVFRT